MKQVLTKEERTPQARQNALTDSLAASGRLYAELQVPDSAGPLEVVADLRSRQVIVSTNIEAPREGRSRGRVSWLLRQLQNSPSTLKVESKIARSQASLATTLEEARQKPEALYPEAGKDIRQFVLTLTRNMGVKRDASKGSFIESVMSITTDFYADVLQNLRAWKAPPPKLKKQVEGEPREESAIQLPELVEEALDQAEAEMAQEAGESPAEQG